MADEREAYKLYAFNTTQENIEYAKRFRFHRITQKYILVYTNSGATVDITAKNMLETSQNSIVITENRISVLSEQDFEWLNDCNIQIIREETQKNERRIIERASEKLEKLEQALIAEHKIISEEANVSEDEESRSE